MSRWQRFSSRDEIVENGTRALVLETIKANPGIHFRETCRKLGKEIGVVQYHIHALVKFELVTAKRDGRYTRYYHKKSGMDPLAMTIIAQMSRPVARDLLRCLLDGNTIKGNSEKLCKEIGVTSQALTWHLHRMEKDGLIDKSWKLSEGIARKCLEMERNGIVQSSRDVTR